MKKRIIACVVAVALLGGLIFAFQVCSSPPPAVEEIYDRVVELVESSYRFNTVFLGEGLPVYEEDSEYAAFSYLYFGTSVPSGYEVVSDYSTYFSIDAIKADAEKIYSKTFLESVWYPMAFDGYAVDDNAGGAIALAKYHQANQQIYLAKSHTNYFMTKDPQTGKPVQREPRIYDYSTMKIINPSNSEACIVQMSSWLSSSPDQITEATVNLVLQDGQWYLNSYTV